MSTPSVGIDGRPVSAMHASRSLFSWTLNSSIYCISSSLALLTSSGFQSIQCSGLGTLEHHPVSIFTSSLPRSPLTNSPIRYFLLHPHLSRTCDGFFSTSWLMMCFVIFGSQIPLSLIAHTSCVCCLRSATWHAVDTLGSESGKPPGPSSASYARDQVSAVDHRSPTRRRVDETGSSVLGSQDSVTEGLNQLSQADSSGMLPLSQVPPRAPRQ